MLNVCRSNRNARRGFTLIELLIVIAIILIIAAIALPRLDKARMHTQEMAAIQQIRTIHTAETQYYSQFGHFAESLTALGPAAGGDSGPSAADLIPGDLANGEKSGYRFQVQPTPTGYAVTAVPVTYNNTGRRSFYSDQSLVVRENWGQEPADESSPEIK